MEEVRRRDDEEGDVDEDEPRDGVAGGAVQPGADRLFVGGRRRSPTGKAAFGSTAHRLLVDAACPVTFVRDGTGDDA